MSLDVATLIWPSTVACTLGVLTDLFFLGSCVWEVVLSSIESATIEADLTDRFRDGIPVPIDGVPLIGAVEILGASRL